MLLYISDTCAMCSEGTLEPITFGLIRPKKRHRPKVGARMKPDWLATGPYAY
jgi:hypothetical protein